MIFINKIREETTQNDSMGGIIDKQCSTVYYESQII